MNNVFEKSLNEFKLGDIYLDVFYHPTICLVIDIDYERKDIGLEGVSLFDGSYPRGCSVIHSAPDKITCEEAWNMKVEYERSRRPEHKNTNEAMRYGDGQEVLVGDEVKLEADQGKIECLMDRNANPAAFGEGVWGGHRKRVVIRFLKRGFVHFIGEIDSNIKLMSRELKESKGSE